MNRTKSSAFSLLVASLVACGGATNGGSGSMGADGGGGAGDGGSGGPPNSVTGTVGGTTFSTIGSELAFVEVSPPIACASPVTPILEDGGTVDAGSCTPTTSNSQGITFILANRGGPTCSVLPRALSKEGTANFANADYLALTVESQNGNVTPGTYDIVTSGDPVVGANSAFITTTATCATGLSLSATTGTVTLTQASSVNVAGTFSVTFGMQGTLSGSFDIPACNEGDAGSSPTAPAQPVCQQ